MSVVCIEALPVIDSCSWPQMMRLKNVGICWMSTKAPVVRKIDLRGRFWCNTRTEDQVSASGGRRKMTLPAKKQHRLSGILKVDDKEQTFECPCQTVIALTTNAIYCQLGVTSIGQLLP